MRQRRSYRKQLSPTAAPHVDSHTHSIRRKSLEEGPGAEDLVSAPGQRTINGRSFSNMIDLHGNQLTNVTMPGSLTALTQLHLAINRLASFTLPSGLMNLTSLDLAENTLTGFTLPGGLTSLTNLELEDNQLTSFTMPADATNLTTLLLFFNQLTNVSLA